MSREQTDQVATAEAGLASLELATEYRTSVSDPVRQFYRPCLFNAEEYKRAVGFFRSTIFLVVGASAVEFARRGGHIRVICSPALTNEDLGSINSGYAARLGAIGHDLVREIEYLLAHEAYAYRTQVLATLVALGAMDIRLAVRPSGYGLYHEKIGVFRDAYGNRVSFVGSANETWSGWHWRGNFESIEVFCTWRGGREAERVDRHDKYFERLWVGLVPDVEIVQFPAAAERRLIQASLGALDAVELEPIDDRPPPRTPLPHQIDALKAWHDLGSRGVFEHATGSGKTYIALLAIKDHVRRGLPALILVPSRLLLDQWWDEIRSEIPESTVLLAGSGNDRWRHPNRLRGLTDPSPELGPRIILATMQTASTDDFLRGVSAGNHLLVVADEVHQIGSPQNSRVLTLSSGPRLGLSATPTRYGDPVGTQKIIDYFGTIILPRVTLYDAIRAGRLVEYEYHPHPVHLTATEADAWRTISQKIRFEIARNRTDEDGPVLLTERTKLLLIQRARIAKKAEAKIALAGSVLAHHYEPGQRWLVYCEDGDHLADVMAELRATGLNPVEYHSAMTGDREATLAWFRSFGGVLVSIKCLDEGVDIPAVSHALILASSQSPRQFIQRRGRVLRKAPGKHLAVVHDAIVVPVSIDDEPDQLSLLKSELVRAIEFANSALNRSAGAELRAIAAQLGIDPDEPANEGLEDDE
jgi:superfamily II DNA or RNA helicase